MSHRMALLVVSAAVGLSTMNVCAQRAGVRVVAPAAPTRTVQAVKDGRQVIVEGRNVKVVLTLPNGEENSGYLMMLREPAIGLYWWTYQGVSAAAQDAPPLKFIVYFTGQRAVGFAFTTPVIGVREIQGRKPDFAAVQEAAVADVQQHLLEIQRGARRWAREVPVGQRLGSDFIFNRRTDSGLPTAALVGVSLVGAQWELTLNGPNQEVARVTLDDQYRLLGVRREPAAR